ncbi:hypothetical protein N665_0097s0009 [Sinapis alba]|nr:hypothetical protein N665_0097s0009 [Sinapis alba]
MGSPLCVPAARVSSSSSPNLIQTLTGGIIDVSIRLKIKARVCRDLLTSRGGTIWRMHTGEWLKKVTRKGRWKQRNTTKQSSIW